MVCALSGLPGTIQLARQCVVTAWFMLRSLICLLCLCNPQPLPCLPLPLPPLVLSVPPALTVLLSAKKAEATSRRRLFLSCCDEPRATFCAVGVKRKKKKPLLSKGSWKRQQGEM